jgi:hypothetical protein
MGKAARKKKLKYQERTPLSGHKREGKRLDPPFVQFGLNKGLVSWMNDRLPEMIWAALLVASLGREAALAEFRQFLRFVWNHPDRELFYDATLTGFAKLSDASRDQIIGFLCRSDGNRRALAFLLLFDALPARAVWEVKLQGQKPGTPVLGEAVRLTLFHQSQEATDCRWVRLMCAVFGRRMIIPSEELTVLNGYPKIGDQRSVRPRIRAAEGLMDAGEARDLSWPRAFWLECWQKTPCMARAPTPGENETAANAQGIELRLLLDIRQKLQTHWEKTHSTTAIDARHDAVFGIAFYALRVAEEALSLNTGQTVLGRLALRTLLEIRITLRHLLNEDRAELWRAWRAYGAGQAKLASLKADESESPVPNYLDEDLLKNIANEDFWEEVVSVDLGHWAHADLRKLSEKVGLKHEYDRYYGWTSGFSHGHWGPIRESVYHTCLNPLHRGHRCPKVGAPKPLLTIEDDLYELLNPILSDLDGAYPGFALRFGDAWRE